MSKDPLEELFGPLEPKDADNTATAANDSLAEALASGDRNAADAQTEAVNDGAAAAERALNGDIFGAPTVANPVETEIPLILPPPPVAPPLPVAHVAPKTPAPVPVSSSVPSNAPAFPVSQPSAYGAAQTSIQARAVADEPPTMPVPAADRRSNSALPWVIIAVVAVIALVAAIFVVSTMNRADEVDPETTVETPQTPDPESPAVDPTEEAPEETQAPEPEATEPPRVEVGPTVAMEISCVSIAVEASGKLEPNGWFCPGGDTNRVTWESRLMNSFPESCAAMRSPSLQSPWGIEQDETGKWIAVRPEGTCAADPELYNEVWGLMQAVADSAKPLGDIASGAETADEAAAETDGQ